MYRLLTCPDSAHLELVEYLDDPLGTLVAGCSRFRPPCALGCPRTCAALIDRGARDLDSIELVDAAPDPTAVTSLGRPSRQRLGSSEESVEAACELAGREPVDDAMVEGGAEPEYRAYLEAVGSDHDGTWPHLGDE